jgi:glycosyltransferase involved in cell wall biosynthesis
MTPTLDVELTVVVPLLNESENLPELYRRLSQTVASCVSAGELLFVNDGSTDETASMLDELHAQDPRVTVVHLSRNFGHQAAIAAGMKHAKGRAVAIIDGDLQDPPEVLPRFLDAWRQGHEVVYAVRTKQGAFRQESGVFCVLSTPSTDQRTRYTARFRGLLLDGPSSRRRGECTSRENAVRPRAKIVRRVPAGRRYLRKSGPGGWETKVHVQRTREARC